MSARVESGNLKLTCGQYFEGIMTSLLMLICESEKTIDVLKISRLRVDFAN